MQLLDVDQLLEGVQLGGDLRQLLVVVVLAKAPEALTKALKNPVPFGATATTSLLRPSGLVLGALRLSPDVHPYG